MLFDKSSVFRLVYFIGSAAYGLFMNKAYISSYAVYISCIYKVIAKSNIVIANRHLFIKSADLIELRT